MIRKILHLLLCVTILVLLTTPNIVKADNTDKEIRDDSENALSVLENYIEYSYRSGETEWEGFRVDSFHDLYNSNLEKIGYEFSLEKENGMGYAILMKDNNGNYLVVESSYDTGSPYGSVDSQYRIYVGPFNYYAYSRGTGYAVSLRGNEQKQLNELIVFRINADDSEEIPIISRELITGYFTKRIYNFYSAFETVQQGAGQCVPTSFAMCLKYFHNTGQTTLSNTNLANIRDSLFSYMNGTIYGCYGSDIWNGYNAYTAYYSSVSIVINAGHGGSEMSFSEVMSEINGDYPLVGLFPAGTFSFNPYAAHACAVIGYKYAVYPSGMGTPYYILIVDPWDQGTKTLSYSSMSGYFIHYVG